MDGLDLRNLRVGVFHCVDLTGSFEMADERQLGTKSVCAKFKEAADKVHRVHMQKCAP